MFSNEGYQKLEALGEKIDEVFTLKVSKKHMSGKILGRMEPSSSLARYAKPASA